MPLITDRRQVEEVFDFAFQKGWVLPAFNAENLTTAESILEAALHHGRHLGVKNLPIIIGITNHYPPRPQSTLYTHTRNWKIGLSLFLKDLGVLTSNDSPYRDLSVLIHLDHIQWDVDRELIDGPMESFSSIMFDASELPFEQNMEKTRVFVEKYSDKILIEGACDEIKEAKADKTGTSSSLNSSGLTTVDMAKRYIRGTGVDVIVANLGTEHRSSQSLLRYHADLAREIAREVRTPLCLHGTSSVSPDYLSRLFEDGVWRVNIWTALERDSTPVLFHEMLKNASHIIGEEKVGRLQEEGYLGPAVVKEGKISLDYYTTLYRQSIIFKEMVDIVRKFLSIWYIPK